MKKFINYLIVIISLFSMSSCIYTDETYVPQAPVYYNTRTIDVVNYIQQGNRININFDTYTSSGRDYYYLVVEDRFGSVYFNGRRWSKVSEDSWFTPIFLYVDYVHIYPNTMYRCLVMSSWGNYSQEFNMYVY
jgi:hypothetical protein